MKFGSACTFVNKPRGETPAPPPRPALSGQIGTCIFRTGRRQQLAFGEHVLSPGAPHLAAQQKQHNRYMSSPPQSHQTYLENGYWAELAARCAPASVRNLSWAASLQRACLCLLGGFRIWFGYLERRLVWPLAGQPHSGLFQIATFELAIRRFREHLDEDVFLRAFIGGERRGREGG